MASRPPEARGEQGTDSLSQPSEGPNPALILDFLPPELDDNKFLFKLSSLWYWFTAVLANQSPAPKPQGTRKGASLERGHPAEAVFIEVAM